MLYNVVEKAKNGDKDAMMELIRKFGSLLHKYANKLEYEDAYQDYVLSISVYKTTIKRKSKQ